MGRPEPGSPGSCGETITVRLRPAGDRAARWSTRVRARGPAGQRDRDRLVLRCLPNATNTGCDAGDPPTPTAVTTSTVAAASTTTTTHPEDCPNAACPTVTTTSVATTSTTDTTLPPDKTCDVSPVMCCQTPLWCWQLVNDGSSDEFRSRCPGVVTPGSCPTSCGAPSACCRVDDCAAYELRGEDDRFDDAICRLAGGVLEAGACTDTRGGACRRTGCSGQLCLDHHVSTTCQWYPYYACFHDAECARQPDIGCAWTATDELRQCLEANGLPSHPFP
jgi:hypothetical protein